MSKVVTVSELTKYLTTLIAGDSALRNLAVTGEISNFKRYGSGHCYFNLKDRQAIIPCVMFRSSAQRLRFLPQDGLQVIAAGRVAVYAEGGRYQLYVENMAPKGVGDLALAFEQLKERLAEEGLFDAAYKKPLPLYPRKIGIVTSASGAVLRDIYRVSKRRFPAVQLVLKPVQVQGRGAAEQIAAAIGFFNACYPVDVLIVGRGGGSLEDLWAFNEEVVVRAIFKSAIPVISAVGHETDFTLADFVADQRAATPSQAAELAVRDAGEIAGQLQNIRARLANALKGKLAGERARLQGLLDRPVLKQPEIMLAGKRQQLDFLRNALLKNSQRQLMERKRRTEHLVDKLEMVNPVRVLRRGYAIGSRADGGILTTVQGVQTGENIQVRLADGILHATVTEVEEV